MKIIKLLFIGLLYTGVVIAQDCSAVLFLKEGTVLEYSNYDKKGKIIGTGTHTTKSLSQEGDKIIALIDMTFNDEKEKNLYNSTYNASCENGLISIDMQRFFDNSKLSAYQDLNIDITGDVLEFPVNMKEGEILNDGNINISVKKETFTIITLTSDVRDRKILASESVTTPAGTYMCNKVSFNFETKLGIIKVKGTATEWYNENKVLVKSESYNKKGKLIGSTLLTAMK